MHRSPIQVFQDTAVKLLAQPPQGLSLDDVLMRLALLRPDILSQIRAEVDTEAVPTPEGGLRGSLRLHPFEIIPQVTRVVTPWGQHGVVSELALTEAHQERGNFQATLRLDLRSTKNDRARALYLELRPAVPQKTGTGATPEALWRSVEWGLKHLRDKLAAYGRARRARSKGQIAWEGMVAGGVTGWVAGLMTIRSRHRREGREHGTDLALCYFGAAIIYVFLWSTLVALAHHPSALGDWSGA